MINLGIAASGSLLFAAWAGSDSDQQLWYSTFDGSSWAAPAQIPGESSVGPSLAVGQGGTLYAAWQGSDSDQRLWYSSFNGSSWAAQAQVPGAQAQIPGPVPAPAAGLGSNSNYILYSNCSPLINLSVTITVTEDLVWQSTAAPGSGPPRRRMASAFS
jgi:hypothetical protein